jgi:hypothetical protein
MNKFEALYESGEGHNRYCDYTIVNCIVKCAKTNNLGIGDVKWMLILDTETFDGSVQAIIKCRCKKSLTIRKRH